MQWLEVSLANLRKGAVAEWCEDGSWYTPTKRGYGGFYHHEPIVSDITKRCHDCGKVSVGRYRGLVRWQCERNWKEKEDIITWFDPHKLITLCIGCSNRRWPDVKALMDWNETRLMHNRIGREITKIKKEQVNEQD